MSNDHQEIDENEFVLNRIQRKLRELINLPPSTPRNIYMRNFFYIDD